MICLICRRVELIERLTSVIFERGEFRLVVKNVPARVCPSCGETYVDEAVAMHLLRDAEETSEAGSLNVIREF